VETISLDEMDRQLVHALVIAPRAPFRLFADVMGISDRTIARRYRKLVSAFGLRVTGVLNGEHLGWTDWCVRLQVRTAEQRDDLFLRGLPGSRRVTQITAQSLLCQYSPVGWAGITSTLSPGQVTALRASGGYPENVLRDPRPAQDVETEPVSLHPGDHLLLAELARDGRASHAALAVALHWHGSTVRRRHHRPHEPDRQRPVPRYAAHVPLHHRPAGRAVRHQVPGDLAHHRQVQAGRPRHPRAQRLSAARHLPVPACCPSR